MKLRMGAAIALAVTGILVSAAGAIASVEADVPYQCVWPAGPTSTHTVPVTLEVPTAAVATGEPFTASWGVGTPLAAPTAIASGEAALHGEIEWAPSATATAQGSPNPSAIGSGEPMALPAMGATITPSAAGTLTLTPGGFAVGISPQAAASAVEVSCTVVSGATPASALVTVGTASPTVTEATTPEPTITVTETATITPTAIPTSTATATITATTASTVAATVTAAAVSTVTATVQVLTTPVGWAKTGEVPDRSQVPAPMAAGGLMLLVAAVLGGSALRRHTRR